LSEESFDAVCAIVVFAVEDIAFVRVDGDVLEHTDEVEGAEFLDETEPVLHGVVVCF
jgi:hypothetical protein